MSKLVPIKNVRHLEWLTDWINGLTLEAIAKKHEVSAVAVRKASSKENWADRKLIVEVERYENHVNQLKGETIRVVNLLTVDLSLLTKEVHEGKRILTKEERQHLMAYYAMMEKAIRASEGKPDTDPTIPLGRVELSVPPEMAAAFAMFSKSSNARVIETTEFTDVTPQDDKPKKP